MENRDKTGRHRAGANGPGPAGLGIAASRSHTVSDPAGRKVAAAGKIYLFPVPLAAGDMSLSLPGGNVGLLRGISYFVVENLRSARRFLKACDRSIDIDSLEMVELNEHTAAEDVAPLLEPILAGQDAGIISEAGCPAVADPGAALVALAQARGIEVVPLVGPSSILLGLMGSGFNGQSFAFSGYLPVDKPRRIKHVKELERRAAAGQTQIFIETPYRNNRLISELSSILGGETLLCVASDLTGVRQSILTRPASWWATAKYDYDKVPAIFLIGGAG